MVLALPRSSIMTEDHAMDNALIMSLMLYNFKTVILDMAVFSGASE